jgi:hypothetical protein
MKCLLVVCTTFIFVESASLSVETKVIITVNIVKKVHSSGICYLQSNQQGKSRSVTNRLHLAMNFPGSATKWLHFSWFYLVRSGQQRKYRRVTDLFVFIIY